MKKVKTNIMFYPTKIDKVDKLILFELFSTLHVDMIFFFDLAINIKQEFSHPSYWARWIDIFAV